MKHSNIQVQIKTVDGFTAWENVLRCLVMSFKL